MFNKAKCVVAYLWHNKVLALMLVLSIWFNFHLLKAQYALRCSVNGKSIGWLVNKQDCEALNQDRFASSELSRINFLKENYDLSNQ